MSQTIHACANAAILIWNVLFKFRFFILRQHLILLHHLLIIMIKRRNYYYKEEFFVCLFAWITPQSQMEMTQFAIQRIVSYTNTHASNVIVLFIHSFIVYSSFMNEPKTAMSKCLLAVKIYLKGKRNRDKNPPNDINLKFHFAIIVRYHYDALFIFIV